MAGFTSKILNNATSALSAAQALIATTGNNIANVNTPGYTRRVVSLETRGGSGNSTSVNVGSGVNVAGVTRVSDQFLEKILQGASSGKSSAEIQSELMGRVDALFQLSEGSGSIGQKMDAFFVAWNDLSANPASIELRKNVIDKAQGLVDTIRSTYDQLAALQREADNRLKNEILTVNSLTSQIAELNIAVSQKEAGGNGAVAADERDRRDVLVNQLAEKISFTSLEAADGSLTISLANGFPLVLGGTSRALATTDTPSFAPGGFTPPALDGQRLSYVVFDYDDTAGSSHLDLTQVFKNGEGTVGGLLKFRGTNSTITTATPFRAEGSVVDAAIRIEALTRNLLTRFNTEYLGPDYSAAAGLQPSAIDLTGAQPTTFGFFDFTGAVDRNGDGIANSVDLGAFESDPTPIPVFSRVLKLNDVLSDPRRLAAALSATSSPALPAVAAGDNRNALRISDLQTQTVIFAAAGFSFTGTYGDMYQETVTHVGNLTSRAKAAASIAADKFTAASNRRDEVSAVSLDEEFTNLIKHQKAFEASARMIQVANDILGQIVQLI